MNNLKQLRSRKGSTQAELAKMLGISQNTYSCWESGKIRLDNLALQKLSAIYNVSIDYLLNNDCGEYQQVTGATGFSFTNTSVRYQPDDSDSEQVNEPQKADLPEQLGIPYQPKNAIPILGKISAGMPMYADEYIEGYTMTDLGTSQEYFALRVEGDSMNSARIYDGDIVIVRYQGDVDNGEIAVVLVDHENATVKRFYRTGDIVTLVPQSTNNEHKMQVYDIHKTDIKVLGKVVEIKIRL